MKTYTRRALLGTGIASAAAIPLAAFVPRAAPQSRKDNERDPIADLMMDDAKRLHDDLKARGYATGEHLRAAARLNRLLVAHAPIDLDGRIKRGVRKRINAEGREGFFNSDFAGHARAMAKQHLGDDLTLTEQPSLVHVQKFTQQALTVGVSPLFGRIAKSLDRLATHVDQSAARGGPDVHLIRVAFLEVECDDFDDPMWCEENGGGGEFSTNWACVVAKTVLDAALIGAAVACNPVLLGLGTWVDALLCLALMTEVGLAEYAVSKAC